MNEPRRPTYDDVLASARQGSPWALGWLYRRFQPGLLRLLDVIAPHHADDIAADVWLDAAGTLPGFSGDERAFRGWLATTARARVIAAHRRSRRRQAPTEEDSVEALAFFAARVVSVLPPEQADVVLLRVLGGFDVDEVARLLGKPRGTVRGLQHRALRHLARQLDPERIPA